MKKILSAVSMTLFILLMISVVTSYWVGYPVTINQEQRLQRACLDFGKNYNKTVEYDRANIKVKTYYSKILDTCIQTEVDELGNEFVILDIKGNFLKDMHAIFYCSSDGVNNAVIPSVRLHNGYVMDVTYSDWLDDYENGLPATLKTPSTPYTRDKCHGLFIKRLKELL